MACLYKNKYYRREISEVVRDIKQIKELGFNRFFSWMTILHRTTGYMLELCQEIKKLDMKWMSQCSINIARNDKLLNVVAESGCDVLSFGLESISKESLDAMNKRWANPKRV